MYGNLTLFIRLLSILMITDDLLFDLFPFGYCLINYLFPILRWWWRMLAIYYYSLLSLAYPIDVIFLMTPLFDTLFCYLSKYSCVLVFHYGDLLPYYLLFSLPVISYSVLLFIYRDDGRLLMTWYNLPLIQMLSVFYSIRYWYVLVAITLCRLILRGIYSVLFRRYPTGDDLTYSIRIMIHFILLYLR